MRSLALFALAVLFSACSQAPLTGDDDRYYGPTPAIRLVHPAGGGFSQPIYSFGVNPEDGDPLLTALCPEGNLVCMAGEELLTDNVIIMHREDETWNLLLHNDGAPFGIAFDPYLTVANTWGRDQVLSDEDCGREVGVIPGSTNFEERIDFWECHIID